MAGLSRSQKKKLRSAGIVFCNAFVGSLITLILGGHYITVSTQGAYIPQWGLMDEMFVSAVISGMIALLSFLQTAFLSTNGNGNGH